MVGAHVKLSILMPVYNEQASVANAVKQALDVRYPCEIELVVVDDGSRDGTTEVLAGLSDPRLSVHVHPRNKGKGAAIRTAATQATGDYMVILDADLEYDPNDLKDLLIPVRERVADAAFGTRAFRAHSAYSFWYVMGNRFLSMATNVIFNTWITDVYTCFKLMPTELMRSLALRENGFTIEAEITGRLLRSGARIYEVPITYVARSREEGKKIRPSDGFRGLITLLRIRFS
jgi:glycosyltransferase involved in cell wall biosynthesis